MTQLVHLLKQKEKKLTITLESMLHETAFDNRYSLHPRRFVEYAQELTASFFEFIENGSTSATIETSGKLAREGLGDKTVVRIGSWIRRFVREERNGNRDSFEAIEEFAETLVIGFMKAREEQILADQEQTRRALATAIERQNREEPRNRYPDRRDRTGQP